MYNIIFSSCACISSCAPLNIHVVEILNVKEFVFIHFFVYVLWWELPSWTFSSPTNYLLLRLVRLYSFLVIHLLSQMTVNTISSHYVSLSVSHCCLNHNLHFFPPWLLNYIFIYLRFFCLHYFLFSCIFSFFCSKKKNCINITS